MPRLVSELSSALSQYCHPGAVFLDVLNEVLPQLANRGIWKDLTFERSISVPTTERFLTLPEDADAVLYGLADNYPTPIQPLWQGFVNLGNQTGQRLGAWFGVEDAGFVSSKELLSSQYYYDLFILPYFSQWGSIASGSIYTDTAFAGTETVKITYETWEGVTKTVSQTVAASSGPQLLKARGVRNVVSVEYTGFTTIPGLIVAVPIQHGGQFQETGTDASVVDIATLPYAYTTLLASYGTTEMFVASLGSTAEFDNELVDFDGTNANDALAAVTYAGSTVTGSIPVSLYPGDIHTRIIYKTGYAENARKIAVCSGTGVARYRLFRVHDTGTNIHLLFKRKIPKFTATTDIVYLDNLSALKYAILANTAEYGNDRAAAREWWKAAEDELDRELDETFGGAQPKPRIDPSGGLGAVEPVM